MDIETEKEIELDKDREVIWNEESLEDYKNWLEKARSAKSWKDLKIKMIIAPRK